MNEFESEILGRIAKDNPALLPLVQQLHVLSREYTGVGSYTNFSPDVASPELPDGYLALDASVSMPGVPNGLGAHLACEAGRPTFLEIYTYGNELWAGDFSGYVIK